MNLDQTLLDLARHMNVTAPSAADAYALVFDAHTQVHLLPTATGRLELMCEAGAIGNRQDADLALRLLALGAPPVSVLADPDTACVVVWACYAPAESRVETLEALVRRVLETAAAVRRCLDSAGKSARPAPRVRTLERLLGQGCLPQQLRKPARP